MKFLIVEDEKDIAKTVSAHLTSEGFKCDVALNYSEAKRCIHINDYDIILLDVTLPDGNGLDLLQFIKKISANVGVLIVSAKNSLDDKLLGLGIGADDYITKPFHLAELNARIKALIRRKNYDGQTIIIYNEIKINPENKLVTINENVINLTKKEYQLLLYFISNQNKLITKEAIAEHLWQDDYDLFENYDFIYSHIKNLRKKINQYCKKDYLKSLYGMGYKLSDL